MYSTNNTDNFDWIWLDFIHWSKNNKQNKQTTKQQQQQKSETPERVISL